MHLREAEIGDLEFPLEAEPEDIIRDHDLVSTNVRVTPYANELLQPHRGEMATVKGVIAKHGQIAGLEVDIDGDRYYAPKKDFFIDRQMVEDVHLQSPRARELSQALKRWRKPRDYYGSSWDGIELFHFYLAKRVESLALEFAGWYRYPSSTRPGMDGKDWRLVVPDGTRHVAINCHSLLHDGVWTLTTTVHSTRDIDRDKLTLTGEPDFWQRVLGWTEAVAEGLQTSGYDYSPVLDALRKRKEGNRVLSDLVRRYSPLVEAAAEGALGRAVKMPPVSAGFSRIRLNAPSVGRLEPPSDEVPYAILTVRPSAGADREYLDYVVKHELAHLALLGTSDDLEPHGELFNAVTAALDIPERFRD